MNYTIYMDPKDFATAAPALIEGGPFAVTINGLTLYRAGMRMKGATILPSGKMLVEFEPIPAPHVNELEEAKKA